MKNTHKRVELYCSLIDIVKAMKLKVATKREINGLNKVETNLSNLMLAEIIKD